MCAGTIYYTIEHFNPNENNPIVSEYYGADLKPLYKKYVHVVPNKPTNDFRLIDIV